MGFDALIDSAWADHADRAQEVADRIAASLHLVQEPAQAAPFARLLAHVLGEHLGQWHTGISLLEALQRLPACADAAAIAAIAQHISTLRYCAGDKSAVAALPVDARVAALADAASMLSGRGEFKAALAAYEDALRVASVDLADRSPAIRSLAVGGNNLAQALEDKPDRDAAETAGMVMAAEKALHYWRLAGTWLEHERAEYRLARSRLAAGQPTPALQIIERCIAICEGNDAPPFERFFGHAVMALAQRAAGDSAGFENSRARALALYAQVPAEERVWCEAELKELGS